MLYTLNSAIVSYRMYMCTIQNKVSQTDRTTDGVKVYS